MEINEKKKSFIMKNEKIVEHKILMGYCPDCIVRNEKFVLQGKVCIAT